MENKQTAVEWLIDKIAYKNYLGYWCAGVEGDTLIQSYVEEAKEMERKQIEEAYYKGSDDSEFLYRGLSDYAGASDYFNKTYSAPKEGSL